MTITQKHFFNVGVNYTKADAHTRGKFSLSVEQQKNLLLKATKEGIEDIFVISTCNRTEISAVVERPCQLIELLCEFSEGTIEEFSSISNVYKNQEAIDHLFRIGTGLDSQILGDYEIVGQLRKSYKLAKKLGVTGPYTERLLNAVLQASKKVKNSTKLSSGTTSVSYAAVQYIMENVSSFNSKNILVFGLGKIGKHTCKNLAYYTKNNSVCLVNRTNEKALQFVKHHPLLRQAHFNNLNEEISKADVLIVSTGAEKSTVTANHVDKNKELLILDLSMPENVASEVGDFDKVTLVNVDELSKITDKTLSVRQEEIPKAERIIDKHKTEFNEWLEHRKYSPAIAILKDSLEGIKNDEINFHKKKITNFDENQAEMLSSRIIQKITTQFVKHLKEENTSTNQSIEVIKKVFQQ